MYTATGPASGLCIHSHSLHQLMDVSKQYGGSNSSTNDEFSQRVSKMSKECVHLGHHVGL